MSRMIHVLALAAGLAIGGAKAGAGEPDASSQDFFELKVRPLLAASCVKCHGEKKSSGGLRLDSREAILAGGDNGPAVVPGDPEGSLLIQAIRHADETLKMPPNRAAAPRRPGRPGRLGRRGRALADGGRGTADRGPGPLGVRAAPDGHAARRTPPAGPRSRSTASSPPGTGPRACTPSRGPTAAR